MNLSGKTMLITGAARRLGKVFALAAARAGADIIIHHNQSSQAAVQTASEIVALGVKSWIYQADFSDPRNASKLIQRAWDIQPFDILVNNASIFESLQAQDTTLAAWQRHMDINLTTPFMLSQTFAALLPTTTIGRIINILDWRALRPGADHFPYTISKAGLAALTKSLAISFAPRITVNGLALGAILPPSDGGNAEKMLQFVPAGRTGTMQEVSDVFLFLLTAPEYITGEIIHLDGGRHLV